MAEVDIKFDKRKMKRIEKQLSSMPRKIPQIMSAGINRAATITKTRLSQKLRENVAVKAAAAKKMITLKRANRKHWRADIRISSRRLPLIRFPVKQTGKGVSYKIAKSGGRKTIESGFIQTMSSGHRGVFTRAGKARKPIVERFGPSLGAAFTFNKMKKWTEAIAAKLLIQNIDSQIRRILGKI